jgi:acetyl esterase/lipase
MHALTLSVSLLSINSRLAPEHPHPALTNDCFAGLKYFSANASKFGVDNKRIAIIGPSGGGGLAAGTALKARDEKLDPPLAFQCLIYPMLDDRHNTESSKQIVDLGVWDRDGNIESWNWYLGRDPSVNPMKTEVSIYASPARCNDLSGLPPSYIDVGDLDLFRDEDVEYAMRLMKAGVPTELHVFPGCYHAWEGCNLGEQPMIWLKLTVSIVFLVFRACRPLILSFVHSLGSHADLQW